MTCRLTFCLVVVALCAYAPSLPAAEAPSSGGFPAEDLEASSLRASQCGVNAVYAALRHYERDVTLNDVIQLAPAEVFDRGMSIAELEALLSACSLNHKAFAGGVQQIVNCLEDGAVVIVPHKASNHFLVYLCRSSRKGFLRYNPPDSATWVDLNRVRQDWEGYAVAVFASDASQPRLSKTIPKTVVAALAVVGGIILLLLGLRLRSRRSGKGAAQ